MQATGKNGKRVTLVEPLDWLLLEELPEEGALAGGLYPLAVRVKDLKKKFLLTPDELATRLRVLKQLGWVADQAVVPASKGAGWQITREGQEALAESRGRDNGNA